MKDKSFNQRFGAWQPQFRNKEAFAGAKAMVIKMMNDQPFVSVIVPVYNVEKYLPSCIESILRQTYQNFELLLIDDGSPDGSGRICDEYAEKDARIRVFHQKNGGVCSARNTGLDNAGGEWILLFDSDDMVSPDLVEYCVTAVSEKELDCFIYGYRNIASDDFAPVTESDPGAETEYMDAKGALKTALIGSKFRMLCCNKIYSRRLWEGIRFPEGRKYGDDTAVTYRLLHKCEKIGYQNIPFYYYRMTPGSALHKEITVENLQIFDSYDELISFMEGNRPSLLNEAYYAYTVRIFDILPRISEADDPVKYLKGIRSHLIGKTAGFLKADITPKQKILILLLRLSPAVFRKVWSMK